MTGTPAVADLTGRIPSWPAASVRHWRSCLRRAELRSLSLHPPPLGHPPLRAALARLLGAEPDEVVVLNGVRAAVQQQARTHDTVILERPTFAGVVDAVRAAGIPSSQAEWGQPFLAAAAAERGARVLCVVTTPWRNPDGRTVDPAFAAGLAELAGTGRTVVLNETYRFAARAAGMASGPPVAGALAVGSLAKVAGGGASVGWVRGAGAIESLGGKWQVWAHPPLLWQEAWAMFLDEGGLAGLAAAFYLRPAAAAGCFLDALPAPVRGAVAGQGSYLLLSLAVDEDTALARLAAQRVRAGAGRDFHTSHPALRLAFTRVSVADARRAAEAFGRCADLFTAQPAYARTAEPARGIAP